MKTCTACGQKKKIAEFREDLGKYGIIENNMCRTCTQEGERHYRKNLNTEELIRKIAKRVF